jgi:hypothetical protein
MPGRSRSAHPPVSRKWRCRGRYVLAGAWRDVEKGDPPVHLTVWSTARDSADLAVLLAALRSVEFRR